MNKIKSFILKYRLHLLALLFIFLIFCVKAYLKHIFYLDFGDEDDNFLLGKYLLDGKKLYADMFSQHQPMTYILSASFQFITHPQNIFLLVKRHREFMIVWSVTWGLFLTFRYGSPLFLTVIIFELSKIYLLGGLFLAESLVAYPLIYIVSYLYTKSKIYPSYAGLQPKGLSKQLRGSYTRANLFASGINISLEFLFISLLLPFVFFNLLPLWPLLGFIYLYFLFKAKNKVGVGMILALGFLSAVLLVSRFISIKDYLYDTIYMNYKYFLPLTKDYSGQFTPIKAFIAPLIALFDTKSTPLLWIIKSASLLLIINFYFLLRNKKYQTVFLTILILGLAGIRYVEPHELMYRAFHMLPWFSLLILITFLLTLRNYKELKDRRYKIGLFGFLLLIFAVTFYQAKVDLFNKTDTATDYYIHFSSHEDYIAAIKILSNNTDTLFVAPFANYLYWNTGVKQYSSYIAFPRAMEKIPFMANDITKKFQTDPPTFLWLDDNKSMFLKYIDRYKVLKKDNYPTKLYINLKKIPQITKDQLEKLKFYRFSFD